MWRLAVGALIVVLVYWLFFRRKSSYKPPVYTETMSEEEMSKEFNRAAGEMSAEMVIKKHLPGNEGKEAEIDQENQVEYEKLNKEFEAQKAKLAKAAEPLTEQAPAPAPPPTPSPVVNVPPEPQTAETQPVSPPAPVSA